jgi:hypothetical protein
MHMRALIVKENSFFGWIRCRTVNLAAQFFSWQVAIVTKQIRTDSFSKTLKLGNRVYVEPTKENCSVFQQLRFNELSVFTRPFN